MRLISREYNQVPCISFNECQDLIIDMSNFAADIILEWGRLIYSVELFLTISESD